VYYSSARLWDDGVILPEDSRIVLGLAVATSMINHENKPPKFGVFRM
jgi:3-methylcrotonyl-CoA carboxylase beta subunit